MSIKIATSGTAFVIWRVASIPADARHLDVHDHDVGPLADGGATASSPVRVTLTCP